MKKTIGLLSGLWLGLAALIAPAQGQQYPVSGGTAGQSVGSIVIMCVNGSNQAVPCGNNTTPLQIAGTFSASLSGFTPNLSFATLTATNASASVALPSGTVVAFQNTGTTAVSCTLGVGSATATASEIVIQPGSTKFAVVGSNTFGACIDLTGSTSNVVVLAGGSGLGIDSGGGGGGGTVNPTTVATWGLFPGQNAASPTNSGLIGGQFNTTPTTITSGNVSPLQLDSAGNLLVNIKAGAGSGGTALADQATFTQGTTSETPMGCLFASSYSAGTTGKSTVVSCTSAGSVHTTVDNATTAIPNNADGVAVQTGAANSPVNNYAYGFNGSTWDRQYTIGNQTQVDVAQTVTASSAYTAGNAVGGLMTVANAARVSGSLGASGTSGILQNVAVNSKSVQTAQMDIFIFNANPSGSTCTDKTAFVLATADFNKVIGVISVPSTVTNNNGWFSGGTGSVGQANNQAMAYALSSATSLFACMVTRGTPTFTATTDISVKFQMLRS